MNQSLLFFRRKKILFYDDASPFKLGDMIYLHKALFVCSLLLLSAQIVFASEANKKTLFIENITPFITWPENNRQGFSICVLNDKEFLNAAQALYTGKSIQKKPVVIHDLEHTDNLSHCEILFIGKKTKAVTELTEIILDKPILTLSDTKAFKDSVMITLFEDDDRIACTINHKVAQQSDLRVSYLLLESVHEVIK